MTQQTAPAWHSETAVVYGEERPLSDVYGGRLYHGSPTQLAPDTVLSPGHARNHAQSADDAVSVSSSAARALTWARSAGASNAHVYEVEPIGQVVAWRAGPANQGRNIRLWEARVPSARVVRCVPDDEIHELEG